jgi:hypothetical protein
LRRDARSGESIDQLRNQVSDLSSRIASVLLTQVRSEGGEDTPTHRYSRTAEAQVRQAEATHPNEVQTDS